jgi:hypothetical protein
LTKPKPVLIGGRAWIPALSDILFVFQPFAGKTVTMLRSFPGVLLVLLNPRRHTKVTPKFVLDWKLSRHSAMKTDCSVCDGSEHMTAHCPGKAAIATPDTRSAGLMQNINGTPAVERKRKGRCPMAPSSCQIFRRDRHEGEEEPPAASAS